MKIYVVTKGQYSDYGIITATTDEELAKKIAEKFSDEYDKAKVEVYEDAEFMLKPAYFIRFNTSGEVVELKDVSCNEYYYDGTNNCHFDACDRVYVTVIADNAETAIKIANEKRAEFLARKAGIA